MQQFCRSNGLQDVSHAQRVYMAHASLYQHGHQSSVNTTSKMAPSLPLSQKFVTFYITVPIKNVITIQNNTPRFFDSWLKYL
jgi:hypothetical protein